MPVWWSRVDYETMRLLLLELFKSSLLLNQSFDVPNSSSNCSHSCVCRLLRWMLSMKSWSFFQRVGFGKQRHPPRTIGRVLKQRQRQQIDTKAVHCSTIVVLTVPPTPKAWIYIPHAIFKPHLCWSISIECMKLFTLDMDDITYEWKDP